MERTAALAFVKLHAGTDTAPALTTEELGAVIDASTRADGTVWATRAVVDALEAKLAKTAGKVDSRVEGTTMNLSQVTAHLTALRRSWRSRCTPGSR